VNVVQDPTSGYHMFYANHFSIFQAFSTDCVNWTREPGYSPQIKFSYDELFQESNGSWVYKNLNAYGSPSVIFKDNGDIDMFFIRTIPGAVNYGKNPPNVTGAGGMMLRLAKGICN